MSETTQIKEEAPAVSISGGAVPSITDPSTNYAFQVKKRVKKKMIKRAKPPYITKGLIGDNT